MLSSAGLASLRTLARYAAAIGLWGMGWGARAALIGVLPPQGFPFLTFFPAVMLTTYLFGIGPGLLCAALSVAAAYASFFPHRPDGFLALDSGDLIALVFFSSILVIDCLILHLLARSKQLAARREKDLVEITNNSPDILTRFDRQYRHLFVSGAVVRLTGRPVSDFLGKSNLEMGMPPELCAQWHASLEAVFRTAKPLTLKFDYAGLTFATQLVPEFSDVDGSVKSVLGVTRDVSEVARHERALEANDRLKDELLATVAHELRNPIATMSSGLQVLEREPGLSSPAARSLAAMRRQTHQMTRLVGDLMDLTRIRARLLDISQTELELRQIIDAAVECCHESSMRSQSQIHLAWPDAPMWVMGDAGRLIQVFTNLLSNAIKFSPDGASVTVSGSTSGPLHTVVVSDHGAGIEADMLDTVFEPFVQAPAGRSRQTGLGIGLALVKTLVDVHGGKVWATSDGPGQGASFFVQLPVAPS
jgi:PAS domain S-box-containing protein